MYLNICSFLPLKEESELALRLVSVLQSRIASIEMWKPKGGEMCRAEDRAAVGFGHVKFALWVEF